jgi:hypothetical protein
MASIYEVALDGNNKHLAGGIDVYPEEEHLLPPPMKGLV